jgi:diguanylate cyclase (GGDEF)-like protein
VADALVEATRSTDLVTRYGADEFTVLLIEAGAKHADLVMNRVQLRLRQLTADRHLPLNIQCRMGFAVSNDAPDSAEEFLRIADEHMQGKRSSQTK